nr:SMI1/KNR4 family protein [uncultured Leptotrichia sp.]
MNKEIFRKRFINLLKNYLVFHNRKAIGYSEEEIKKIEKLYDIEVKGDFREFLRIAGRNSGGILGYGYLVFYNPFFTPRKNLIFQEFDRNMFYKIGMKNILKSKIFVFSVEDETIEYFIKTSDDDFKVYKYYESYDKIEEVSMNFDEYMRLLIYIKEPNNDNFIGDLLPKEIKNLNKNITPQKIDNYLSEDKKNDNNFIYLLKNI